MKAGWSRAVGVVDRISLSEVGLVSCLLGFLLAVRFPLNPRPLESSSKLKMVKSKSLSTVQTDRGLFGIPKYKIRSQRNFEIKSHEL